jgi:SulP family sulfate permease
LSSIKYLILDMRRVHSVDYTAVHRLDQIEHTLSEKNGAMVFTSVPLNLPTGQNVQKYLEKLGLSRIGRSIRFFKDLDEGLLWAEEKILDETRVGGAGKDRPLSLSEIHIFSGLEPSLIDLLATCITEKKYESDERIFSKGDTGKEIFFIRQGSIHIYLPLVGGMHEHLATFGMGDFFGDMSFLVQGERSADAVAEDDVYLYILSRPAFDRLTSENPRLGEIVFERLASELVVRLRQNVILLKTLVEC